MPRRRTVLVAGVVALLAGLGGVAYAVWTGEDRYAHGLAHYLSREGETTSRVDLPDGRAELAMGSPDKHRIVVQWRDPDGHGWTAPRTVWRAGARLTAVDSSVAYGGGTVAVNQSFIATSSLDDSRNVMVGIVCRELRCVASRVPTHGVPQVTPDGRTALLAQGPSGVVAWTASDGIRAERWSGRPDGRPPVRSTPPALLAPDGSLRVVNAKRSARACTVELLVSGRRSTELGRVASRTVPRRGRWEAGCEFDVDTISSDWVAVRPGLQRKADFWFLRRGGTWSSTRDDPSRMVVVDRGEACCSTEIYGPTWDQVSLASPDGGRHLLLQTHVPGREIWEPAVEVDGAPSPYVCDARQVDLREVGRSGAFLTLACRLGGTAEEPRGSAYLVAGSPDLRRWESRVVPGRVGREDLHVEGDTAIVGRTTWSPSAGFGTR